MGSNVVNAARERKEEARQLENAYRFIHTHQKAACTGKALTYTSNISPKDLSCEFCENKESIGSIIFCYNGENFPAISLCNRCFVKAKRKLESTIKELGGIENLDEGGKTDAINNAIAAAIWDRVEY